MVNAIDLATKLNSTTAKNLVHEGITHVGRYLAERTWAWKGLTADEVKDIKSAGLNIFSLFEKGGNKAAYFTGSQGVADAKDAYTWAKNVGQPEGTAIYFAVDFDAQPANFPAILEYFKSVKANLKGYKVGAYGSFKTLTFLQPQNVAQYFFQTYAWSGGNRCKFNHVFQFQNGRTLAGITVDYVNMEQKEIGAWGQPKTTDAKNPDMYRLYNGKEIYDTSYPTKVFVKLHDGFSCESVPNNSMSKGMIRFINESGDVIDTSDPSKANALIQSGYLIAFHS
jgi:hypothetical protein